MAVQRGEIYFVDLNPVQGWKQAGLRPVLVVSAMNSGHNPGIDSTKKLPGEGCKRPKPPFHQG